MKKSKTYYAITCRPIICSRGSNKSARSWDTTEYTIYRYTLHGLLWFHPMSWKHSVYHFNQLRTLHAKQSFYTEKKIQDHNLIILFQFLLINELCMEGQVYWNNFHDWFILSQLFWRQCWNLNYIFHLLCTFCHILLNPWSFKS